MITNDSYDGLATISQDGEVPETRMASAADASARIQQLLYSDRQGRAQRRARVKGLVDGNPPYQNEAQRRAGRAQACNVNWRVPEAYLNMARYAFYDVFSESPTFATVRTKFGESEAQKQEYSGIITEEYDKLIRQDWSWDRTNQFSQYDMVLYGCGPMVFVDDVDWRNEFVQCANLLVPDFTLSDTSRWEECAILRSYLPHELYQFICNEKIAEEKGWNVEATKQAIMMAHPRWNDGGQYITWEWHQQRLKNRSFIQSYESKTIQAAHYYFREFKHAGETEGKITHCIVINPEDSQVAMSDKYLFRRLKRFDNWQQIIHPMYYDNDGGGYHHSVTGLGTKMYSAFEYMNRLLCNAADKAFAPKLFFKSLNANSQEKLSLVQFAEYGQMPPGFDIVQTPINSHLEENLALNRELSGMLASNLSQYRQELSKDGGNPITAREATIRASEQARLGKTQLNHYYNQLDWLLAEKYRRAINPKLTGFMPGGYDAKQFQNACLERGVPRMAMHQVEWVKATRVVGQGSQYMRQQALQQILAVSGMIPSEEGRLNAVTDFIASVAGQSMAERYMPKEITSPGIADQNAIAVLQVTAARQGVAPVVGGSQNHLVFAQVFLQAAVEAIQSIPKGGDITAIYSFISVLAPAIGQHLQFLKQDPSRQKEVASIEKQLMILGQAQAALEQKIQQQQREQQQNQQRQQEMVNGAMLDQIELQNKLRMAQQKTDAGIEMKREKQNQSLALNDASTAASIRLKTLQAQADEALKARETANQTE